MVVKNSKYSLNYNNKDEYEFTFKRNDGKSLKKSDITILQEFLEFALAIQFAKTINYNANISITTALKINVNKMFDELFFVNVLDQKMSIRISL